MAKLYFSPLPALKGGVGLTFTVGGTPSVVEIVGTAGTAYEIRWAEEVPAIIDGWQPITTGTLREGVTTNEVPERQGGVWLLWLTDLPEVAADEFRSTIFEVTYR